MKSYTITVNGVAYDVKAQEMEQHLWLYQKQHQRPLPRQPLRLQQHLPQQQALSK